MSTTRRDFIELTVLAGAAGVALAQRTAAAGPEVGRASRPLKILVLGGTGLIGPPMVAYAVARGHQVTLFNRGKTNTELFPELERIIGDRNDDISALAAEVAKGRRWDVVIDNTASIPRWVE
jgi:2'-hydroxyisoflavone reductase